MSSPQPSADNKSAGTLPIAGLGAIDCDVHPRSPRRQDLLPYVNDYWRDIFMSREIDHLELSGYPEYLRPNRADAAAGNGDAVSLGKALLDPLKLDAAILNVVSGIHAVFDPYLAQVLCQATNRWLAAEWLDRDPRLRASLVVPFQHPEAAVAEIEAYAKDHRFVQVIAIVMGESPLGQRKYWPIYEAAARHGFALNVHAGNNYRHAPTQSGFNSFLVEDFVHQTQGFANQVGSFLAEGVLAKFPEMKIVLSESGVTWMPSLMWRMSKDWRGVRIEVPWVKELPAHLMRKQVRLTLQPFDGPSDPAQAARAIAHLGGDEMLLFSSDYPHDHRMDVAYWPATLPQELAARAARQNALETYARLEV
jgi:predicted TIM-barrel fold metal-dependent hydrolase